jgi:hypothetical protein
MDGAADAYGARDIIEEARETGRVERSVRYRHGRGGWKIS